MADSSLRVLGEQQYRLLADTIPQLVWITDPEGKIAYLNKPALDYSGLKLEDYAGRAWEKLIHPEDLASTWESWQTTRQTGQPKDIAFRIRRADGEYRWHIARQAALRDAQGAVTSWLGTCTDVHDHKLQEQRLRRDQAILSQAGKLANLGAWEIEFLSLDNLDLNPVWWSDQVYRLYGYEPGAIVPTHQLIWKHVHPADQDRVRATIQHTMTTKEPFQIEYRILRADGVVRFIADRAELILDQTGRPFRIVGAVQDITERRLADTVIAGQTRILERIAFGAPFAELLAEICRVVEEQSCESLCSILLVDREGVCLRTGAGPSLPAAFNAAVDGLPIGPRMGSCGTAAYRGEPVIVSDIRSDPLWADYQEFALAHGLHACWSVPILSSASQRAPGRVLGTFAVYHRAPISSFAGLEEILARAAHLARIAIEREYHLRTISENEERYRDLVELAPDGFAIIQHGRLVYVNQQTARLVGVDSPTALIGKSLEEFLPSEDLPALIRCHKWIVETRQQSPLRQFRVRRWDGSWMVMESCAGPCQHNGEPAVQIIVRDVSEQTRAQEALRLRDRAIHSVSQGILIADFSLPDNAIIYASPSFERLTGYPLQDVVGHNCRFLQGKDTDPAAVDKIRETLRSGTSCTVELLNYRKDGTPFWNELSLSPLRDPDGRLTHYVGVQSDVTERRQLEDQYRQAQKMEVIGQLAGGVAHDFNNLLTVINGYSDLLLMALAPTDPNREQVAAVRDAGEKAAWLTAQLLAVSRKTIIEPKILNLNEVVDSISKMLRRLIGENVILTPVLTSQPGRVKADPGQIEQVVMNLILNARDAMPQGGLLTLETNTLDLQVHNASSYPGLPPGSYVQLKVSDTGTGMTPEVKAKLFEPFFTTKGVGKGTGLGLATVYGIVKQAGGHIGVDSTPGKGSTFEVLLPRIEPASATPGAEEIRVAPRGTETILVVEDDDAVRGLAQIALQMQGYTVIDASCGEEALQLVNDHPAPIHLLLTDVVMPNMGGRELATLLKAQHPQMPVVYMSGYIDDAIVRQEIREAADVLLRKPFTALVLARKVREVLDEDAILPPPQVKERSNDTSSQGNSVS